MYNYVYVFIYIYVCVAWPSSGLRHTIFLFGAHLDLLLAWNPGLLGLTAEAVPAKGCLSEDG